jgi:hypothetical protein
VLHVRMAAGFTMESLRGSMGTTPAIPS